MNRRQLLRSGLASLALPFLPSFTAGAGCARSSATSTTTRLVMFMLPNPRKFLPRGGLLDLSGVFAPLAGHSDRLLHLTGVDNRVAGGAVASGMHAAAMPGWSTSRGPERGNGDTLRVGESIDQLIARRWPERPLPSLVLGTGTLEPTLCFTDWACAYLDHLSWSGPGTPVPQLIDPGAVFDVLFRSGAVDEGAAARAAGLSVLDLVAEDARSLANRLSGADRRRMDEYLTSVRTLERGLVRVPPPAPEGIVRPPKALSFEEHVRQLIDLSVLALQLDLTRVVSFLYGHSAHALTYDWLGATMPHHALVHSVNPDPALLERIEAFQYRQVGYLLDSLAQASTANGSLADETLVLVGHEFGDSPAHNHAGHHLWMRVPPSLGIKAGVELDLKDEPLGNVHLTVLKALGLDEPSFGETGRSIVAAIEP